MRFSFAAMASTGQDIRYDLDRTAGYRNFCTKLWNAARFVLMQHTREKGIQSSGNGGRTLSAGTEIPDPKTSASSAASIANRWIVSRLGRALAATASALDSYRLDLASRAMYDFVWREYCDWHLELAKHILGAGKAEEAAATRATLVQVLEVILRALHPIMPFITEALWQRAAPLVGATGDSVMIAPWPQAGEFPEDATAEAEIEWLQGFVLGIRQIRGELNLPPGRKLDVLVQGADDQDRARMRSLSGLLHPMAGINELSELAADAEPPPAASALHGEMRLLTPLAGIIDPVAERTRLEKLRAQTEKALQATEKKLANPQFLAKAPPEVVQAAEDRRCALARDLESLAEQIQRLDAMRD